VFSHYIFMGASFFIQGLFLLAPYFSMVPLFLSVIFLLASYIFRGAFFIGGLFVSPLHF
jgi:hypothetical protein